MNVLNQSKYGVLVVDLDGTLLASDVLYESIWDVFSRDWTLPFTIATSLVSGSRAELKRDLQERVTFDVAAFPYKQAVIDYVKQWKADGGKAALVTASDENIAKEIAAHLDIFDDVYGSDGVRNLKGSEKAAFLEETYGEKSYVYMGDSSADLDVWPFAVKAITVDASEKTKRRVEQLGIEVEHLTTLKPSVSAYTKALRPHQWLKNILVFLPIFAAHQFTAEALVLGITAFLAFGFVASSVYVTNDLLDLAADRAHVRKCNRPFASGRVPIQHGSVMAVGLLLLGFLISAFLGVAFVGVLAVYYIITTAYSLHLKRLIIIDIFVLSTLYTLRIIAGGAASGIVLSVWLLAFSIFFFFALAAIKRQAELVDLAARNKLTTAGRGYHIDDLDIISQIATSAGYASVLVMALYLNSPGNAALYSTPQWLWGICLILLFWITQMVMITHRGAMHDDPVLFAAKDKVSLLCFAGILISAVLGAVL